MIRRTVVALTSVLALTLTASVPAYAASAPAHAPTLAVAADYDTNVTANAGPEPVAEGRTLTVKGSLKRNTDGQWRPYSARVLTVHHDPTGSAGSRQVATVRTTSNGSYTRQFTASRSGTWTVKFGGNSSHQPDHAADGICVYSAGRWQCPVSSTNPDLDCADVGERVWVGSKDYHRLDADDDGWGCDSLG
ncbi:hypothetical protein APR04_000254 [Promicromonospora umidemergens]|uniref:Excalibur calcium-binding domain-containing protein n=1 Tax=Promicromonospora umidemergens TaxID=629679 RepID=A0ABP8X7V0_9MICO|nr:hypothetical protein [Promicromonospora umidemergens]MCP2281365.1 hypothetical protein [Promicromonospora umidemergens]